MTFKSDGSAVHIDTDKGGLKYAYIYSAASFSGIGMINGRVVRCIAAAEHIRQKVRRRYSPWSETRRRERGVSADLEDIGALLRVYGVREGKLAHAATTPEAQPSDTTIVVATEQFCLPHVASLSARHAELGAQHEALCKQHASLAAQHSELIAHINAMRASTSWQLTAPMRWAVRRLGLDRLRLRIQ